MQGRFISPDPLLASGKSLQPQSWNRYNYCGNNPLNIIDPAGLDRWYKSGQSVNTPQWFDRDPGDGYERWTDHSSYVYQSGTSGKWWALNPHAGKAQSFDNQDDANAAFDSYKGGSGLIEASQGEIEFAHGFSAGLTPLGIFSNMVNEANGLDTTSRDYKTRMVLGMGIGGGLGAASNLMRAGAGSAGASEVSWITPGSLPAAEEAQVLNSLGHIDAGTQPVGPLATRWGIPFGNNEGYLPGVAGGGGYSEFRVMPPSGVTNAGVRRIVVSDLDGAMYYSWTHYGDTGSPAFVRIR